MNPYPRLLRLSLAPLTAGLLPLGAQTILIDYDDGIPDNGIHDAIVNDGEFTTTTGAGDPWTSVGTGAVQFNGNGGPDAPTGSPRNYISSVGRVLALDTGHTLSASDILDFTYWWIDKANFVDTTDTIQGVLYVTDNNLIDGTDVEAIVVNSGLSTMNATWEEVSVEGAAFSEAAIGKTLFVRIENLAGATGRFARHDNIYLKVDTAADPTLAVTTGTDPDFAFGDLFHAAGTDSTVRTVTFANTGNAENITIDAVSLTGDSIFSLTDAPVTGTIIAPGETFTVEVTATGGGGFVRPSAELLVDVSHANSPANDQDQILPVRATIATTGDPYPVIDNGSLDNGLASWTGNAVSVAGMVAGSGARVRGIGDDREVPGTSFANNLSQAFRLGESPNFTLTCFIAIPDFRTWTEFDPFPDSFDRSFHLAVLASTATPGNNALDDTDNANTLINLFYFPAGTNNGIGTITPAGFHLFDGSTGLFVHLPDLGTLDTSIDADNDGALTPDGGDTLNVYQLTVTGTGFGSAEASYDIAISAPNETAIAGTASDLSISHGANIAEQTARAIVFTTADSDAGSITNPGDPPAYQPSFWIDEIGVTNGLALPVALASLVEAPPFLQLRPRSRASLSFTLGNIGSHEDLVISSAVFNDERFTITSPGIPATIAPGDTQVFEVEFDSRASTDTEDVSATLTAETNDGVEARRTLDLSIRIVPDGRLVLIDYDDGIPDNGIHDASVRSGGFEDNTLGDSLGNAEYWQSAFAPEGNDNILVEDTEPLSGLLHGVTSGWVAGSTGLPRAQTAQWIPLEEWTLAEGDSFTVEVSWKDGTNFDTTTTDNLQAIIEVRDVDGAFINDPVNAEGGNAPRLLSRLLIFENAGSYQTNTLTSKPIQPGSPWIGHRPALRFLVTSGTNDRSHFAMIDNVSLVAHVISDQLAISEFSLDPETGDAFLRWNDTKQGYKIQSSSDLTFGEGTVEFPVTDADADYTTYPGEVQFSFNDPDAIPGPRFWRVVAD